MLPDKRMTSNVNQYCHAWRTLRRKFERIGFESAGGMDPSITFRHIKYNGQVDLPGWFMFLITKLFDKKKVKKLEKEISHLRRIQRQQQKQYEKWILRGATDVDKLLGTE
jgi:hypothetical protein